MAKKLKDKYSRNITTVMHDQLHYMAMIAADLENNPNPAINKMLMDLAEYTRRAMIKEMARER